MAAARRSTDPLARLRAFAAQLPGAVEDTPWDDSLVAKVNKKIFVFFGSAPASGAISVKLPESGDEARRVPGAVPTSYGLGRHGWVTVPIREPAVLPLDVLCDWIEESYRTVAPKRLVTDLDRRAGA